VAADLILRGATVHTVDAARPTAAAVAIAAGRIAAVGDAREVDALRGPATRVVDLDGAMVLPGFQDAHCHLGESGHATTLCSLEGSRDAAEHERRIAAYRDAHPERDWVVGSGWSMSDFPGGTPTAAALDAVVPDRPAVLTNRDIHGAWVNSRALEAAGITAATLDPYLDAAGQTTGEHGLRMYPQADLERIVRLCDAERFGVHIHTNGDRAVRDSLDALEAAARANGRRDARHQLAHVQFAHPDDLPRFGALGVIANVTPLWARLEAYVAEMTLPFVSARAGAGMYPYA